MDIDGNVHISEESHLEQFGSPEQAPQNLADVFMPEEAPESTPPNTSAPSKANSQPSGANTVTRQTATRALTDNEMGLATEVSHVVPELPRVTSGELTQQVESSMTATRALDPQGSIQDVLSYANSPESQGREGTYFFDVKISGIDSLELRETLKTLLTDKKMGWEPELILKGVRQGELHLKGMNAVRASVLISRMLDTPFLISWQQHSLMEPQR